MRNFIVAIITLLFLVVLYKLFVLIFGKVVMAAFKIKLDKKGRHKFDLIMSILLYVLSIYLWVIILDVVNTKYGLNNLEFYISFCTIGFLSVVWCYFSWDVDHILVKPRFAEKDERRIKKICIYCMILLFVLVQGYHQTIHAVDSEVKINVLFSITNYSVIVGTIAFDRVLNQIFNK